MEEGGEATKSDERGASVQEVEKRLILMKFAMKDMVLVELLLSLMP